MQEPSSSNTHVVAYHDHADHAQAVQAATAAAPAAAPGSIPEATTVNADDTSVAAVAAQGMLQQHLASMSSLHAMNAMHTMTAQQLSANNMNVLGVGTGVASSNTAGSTTSGPKRRRAPEGYGNLTVEQKRRICEKNRATPKITQKDLCRWAKLEFGLVKGPTQPTMSNILKHEHMFKDSVGGVLGMDRKTIRPTKHAHFDTVLANWVMERQNNGNITGDMIKTKGRELATQMHIDGKLNFSNGWLASFKARHGLIKRAAIGSTDRVLLTSAQGETTTSSHHAGELLDAATPAAALELTATAASISNNNPAALSVDSNSYVLPPVSIDLTLEQVQETLRDYAPRDIYTVDETGLFYRTPPQKLAVQGGNGSDDAQTLLEDEARLTVVLAANADATDVLEPYIIGSVMAPKAIKHASLQSLGFHYVCSSKARMTVFVFQQWLRDFNIRMASAHRHVILLMDNAPSHVLGCVMLSNVRVIVFAPQLGMKAQPMRNGILPAFKGKYRLKHLSLAIDQMEDGVASIYYTTQLQAMRWIVDVWRQMPRDVLIDAWKPLGVVVATASTPFGFEDAATTATTTTTAAAAAADNKNVEEELWGLLYCLHLSGIVNTKVLVNSRWENDVHKRMDVDMIDVPEANDAEFQMADALPLASNRMQAQGTSHQPTTVATAAAANDVVRTLPPITAREQLKAFRDVIRYLERTGTADARDVELQQVVTFLKKKQMSLRFDNASSSALTI